MSLFEWLGEVRNRGPVGTVESGHPRPGHWHPAVILLRAVIAVVALVASGLFITRTADTTTDAVAIVLGLLAYCGIAYWFSPRPELENVGWASGLFDHPFRWSDDMNRGLVYFAVVFWPGRFLTVSLRDVVRYWRGRRMMILPPRR